MLRFPTVWELSKTHLMILDGFLFSLSLKELMSNKETVICVLHYSNFVLVQMYVFIVFFVYFFIYIWRIKNTFLFCVKQEVENVYCTLILTDGRQQLKSKHRMEYIRNHLFLKYTLHFSSPFWSHMNSCPWIFFLIFLNVCLHIIFL